jgi:pimeloyl-ACP methyl ester carboxylesterase
MRVFAPRKLLLVGFATLLAACSTPAQRAEERATRLGFSRQLVPGAAFAHVVYHRPDDATGPALHVYLEGDASPRRAMRYRPPDPTPRDPLMLHLMALDPAPSVYLGRPCQHGAPPCDPRHWTVGRFGDAVVTSLVHAVRSVERRRGASSLVLIGYSGGGALAMLMAERLPETRALVTVAGNLAVEAWAAHHGYAPLSSSLDPARRPALGPDLIQLHAVGGRDRRVPHALTRDVIARQGGAKTLLFPDRDHSCCWVSAWPSILAELERSLAERP